MTLVRLPFASFARRSRSVSPATSASNMAPPRRPAHLRPRSRLDIGLLQQLVHAVRGLDPIPDEALPMSREIAHVADRWRRDEASDEPMREEVRDPLAVLHVGLPARHGLHVVRIGQDYLDAPPRGG